MLTDMLATYRRDGFALAGRLPEALVAESQDRIDRILASLPDTIRAEAVFERDLPDRKRGGIAAATAGDAVFILGDLFRADPFFAAVLAHDAVVAPIRAALGSDDIVHHFSNLTTKAAWFGSGISWHRDAANTYMPTTHACFVRALICLDAMDADNGGTRFRPGSHAGEDGTAEVAPDCPAGTVLLIHPQVLHGGPPNHSARRRRCIVVQWGRRDDPVLTDNREALTGLSPEGMRGRA